MVEFDIKPIRVTNEELIENRFSNILKGNHACAGCGGTLAMRIISKAFGRNVIYVIPASCSSVRQGFIPKSAMACPVFNTAFASAAAVASGIAAALKYQGRDDVVPVVRAGDGGTVDIGLATLSGAAERQTNMIYVCYDNEEYGNTGYQRSGATPPGARTTTTPIKGKREFKKPVPVLMADHGVPYVATASIGYVPDMYKKAYRARRQIKNGFRYIHVHFTCPPGRGTDPRDCVGLAKLAVDTGLRPLYEVINGKRYLNGISKKQYLEPDKYMKPVEEYLKYQRRYRGYTEEDVELLNRYRERYRDLIKRHVKYTNPELEEI